MSYETTAGMPTKGIEFAKLIEHLRLAQESCALLAHLNEDRQISQGWLAIEELMKRAQYQITKLATRGLN